EGLVGGAAMAPTGMFLARYGFDRFGRNEPQFVDDAGIGQHGRAFAAGGIDIHMGDATAVELVEIFVGIPGRAGIAAMGMTRPEADAQPTIPILSPSGQQS